MSKKLFYLFTILILLTFLNVVEAGTKEIVTISKVCDGDTIDVVRSNGKIARVRLVGIDCYETSPYDRAYRQAYENNITIEEVLVNGFKAKKELVKLFQTHYQKTIYLEEKGIDKYNRILGVIYIDKINVNEYMIKQGCALRYIYIKQ